jgi:hypothetical protein
MNPPSPPVEWIEGDSKATFMAGSFLLLFCAYFVGSLIGQTAFPQRHPPELLPFLFQLGVMAAIALPSNLLYFLSVPCPQRIGISPLGLSVEFGLRKKEYPWHDVHSRPNEALCFAGRSPWPTKVALSASQQSRIATFFGRTFTPNLGTIGARP